MNGIDASIPEQGAALAFYAMLSLVPLFLFLMSAVSVVFGTEAAQDHIRYWVEQFAGENGATAFSNVVQVSSATQSKGVTTTIFNSGMLFFGASGVFTQLQNVLNSIWKIPGHKQAILWTIKEHFFSIVMVFCAGLLLIAATLAGTLMTTAIHFVAAYMPTAEKAAQVFTLFTNSVLVAAIFAVTYKIIPDTPIAWSDVGLGAVIAAVFFSVGQYLIGYYLARTGLVAQYGASGSLVAFLVWIYYSAQIYFFGAQFTEIYARRYGSRYHASGAGGLHASVAR